MNIFKAAQIADDAADGKPLPRDLIGQACAKLVEAYRALLFDQETPEASEPAGQWVNGYFIPSGEPAANELPNLEYAAGQVFYRD